MNKVIPLVLAVVLHVAGLSARPQGKPAQLPSDLSLLLAPLFGGLEGAFAICDIGDGRLSRYNSKRCAERFRPFSSFKIVNALIALETGVAEDADLVIPFRPEEQPDKEEWVKNGFKDWLRDHTLRSAFKFSVVWYYQELARRIGAKRMSAYLGRIRYRNGDLSDGIDCFWLTGSLEVSADEQVDFLARLLRSELGFSTRTIGIVKDIMIRETGDGKSLGAKTGGGYIDEKAFGWYVGFVERAGHTYAFALNVDGPDFNAIRTRRIELAGRILRRLSLLP